MHIHEYTTSSFHDYEECTICGTLHHLNPLAPDTIYTDEYWSSKHSHSSLRDQIYNCDIHKENGLTKNEFVLSKLPKSNKTLLEIGCAPGSTLNAIMREGKAKVIVGSEYDASYADEIKEIIGHPVELIFGPFPESFETYEDMAFSTIIALDVFEHIFYPNVFLEKCSLLLNNKGCLLLMLPLVSEDSELTSRFRHPEHVFLYTKKCIIELLEGHGFKNISFSRWVEGHDVVKAYKR